MNLKVKQLDDLGQRIFEQRYAYPGETSWSKCASRVARHLASAESDGNQEKWEKKIREVIAAGDFVPGGRILFGSGRNNGRYNLLNCYVLCPQDSVASIGHLLKDMYTISCAGGGVGIYFGNIRPKGDDVGSIKNMAPGSISEMRKINSIGEEVKAGANRRVALMGILPVTHPDVMEFLHVKLDKGQLNNFNISVSVTNEFIRSCRQGEDWTFSFKGRTYKLYTLDRVCGDSESKEFGAIEKIQIVALSEEDALARAQNFRLKHFADTFSNPVETPIKAVEIFKKIWTHAVECGDPGIYNVDFANTHTNVSYFETMHSTNPCGEIPLPHAGNCCLGHINLDNMVYFNELGVPEFDWKRFANAVRVGVRALDNVLTVNDFPTTECREVAHRSRRIGLGIIGYHYALIKLGLRYGSEKALEWTERLMMTMRDEAYLTSSYIAREKGSFDMFDPDKFLEEKFAKTLNTRIRHIIRKNGMRNAVLLTVAPTGTTGMVMGVSTGLEPIFAPMYTRRYRVSNIWKEEIVMDPLLRWFYENDLSFDPEIFVGAYDVTPLEHILTQSCFQNYIDSAVSKTINIPEGMEASELLGDALDHISDLKGLTVYRAGSKGNEPLSAMKLTDENVDAYYAQFETKEDIKSEVADAAVCNLNGECG